MHHRLLILTILLALGLLPAASAAPDPAADAIFQKLMTAAISSDYDGFMAECDATMKAALTKAQLESVSRQIAPRLKPGYYTEYLGELNQRGFAVHLWRVRAREGGDDLLATLSVKDGKAGGFYLH